MRTYERTHPWIAFEAHLESAPWHLWAALGECQSKCHHVAGVPLRPETARQLYRIYLAKGALASAAIEGNTLTEEQARQHVEGTLELPRSQEYLEQEIDNIIKACEAVTDAVVQRGDTALTPERIREFNQLVLKDLALEEGVVPGEYPPYVVGVARYRGAPPEDREYLLSRLCEWISQDWLPPGPLRAGHDARIIFGILKAIFAHLHFEWIHPFGDGNGRTGRLIEFHLLVAHGVPLPSAQLLSNHYNKTRTEYYRHLDRSSRRPEHVIDFLIYAVQGLLDGLREQLDHIRSQQLKVFWENYVYETFRSTKASEAARRRRQLVLDLTSSSQPIPRSALSRLSPELAAFYATKTEKTLLRDINDLLKRKLIRKKMGGYVANTRRILAFLPPRHLRD